MSWITCVCICMRESVWACTRMLLLFVHSLAFCVFSLSFFYSFTEKCGTCQFHPFLNHLGSWNLGLNLESLVQADYSYASPGYNTSVSLVPCPRWSQLLILSWVSWGSWWWLSSSILPHASHTYLCYRNKPDCMFWPDSSAYHTGTCCMEGYTCHRHHTHTCATETSQTACSDQIVLHILLAPAVRRDTPATGITHIPVLQKWARLHGLTRCFCISYRHLLYGEIHLPQASHIPVPQEQARLCCSHQMLPYVSLAPAVWRDTSCHTHHTHTCGTETGQNAHSGEKQLPVLPAPAVWRCFFWGGVFFAKHIVVGRLFT